MAFKPSITRRVRWAACSAALLACAHDPRQFALRAPVVRDQDLDPVRVDCPAQPAKKGVEAAACMPETYESSFAWDAADMSIFRPISKFFQVDSYGEAENVNAFDEVPDSSWFTNRIGARPMSLDAVSQGFCAGGPVLDGAEAGDGSWLIDHGKDNGANPGFRIRVKGTKFMLKTDDQQAERATAAAAIASRFYHAFGWWSPCDSVVYFKRSTLKLKPGLTIKANLGPPKKFDEQLLGKILSQAGRRGELYRAVASRWLPGQALGPFTYEGTRDDDPSDTVKHENRRDLRGARVLAAWLNHFDAREQNSMSTWMPSNEKDPRSPGYVRHWYIDLGDCFGSEWDLDGISRRLGHSFVLDFNHIGEDFISLGTIKRPWDTAHRTPGAENFGYFDSPDFDPDAWHSEYPNPAFGRLTERDAAWAARIIARFSPEAVRAAVNVGNFTNPAHTEFLTRVLLQRQHVLLKRYFSKLSPLADAHVEGRRFCATDLARSTATFAPSSFRYNATLSYGTNDASPVATEFAGPAETCVALPPAPLDARLPPTAPERYVVLRVFNGVAPGPLAAHFYDLGPERGLRLVGLERPGS